MRALDPAMWWKPIRTEGGGFEDTVMGFAMLANASIRKVAIGCRQRQRHDANTNICVLNHHVIAIARGIKLPVRQKINTKRL